ncbi:hypothetical protein BH10ACT11_BH10ACT11_15480 [soil metagenome]
MQGLLDFLGASRRNYAIAVAAVALLIALAVALTTGLIGGDDTPETFDAKSFVDAANDKGANLVLGDPLISSQKGVKIYGIAFKDSTAPSGKSDDEHGSASLTVSPDSDGAREVYDQCEATQSFICYRANNVSLVFDHGSDPTELADVDTAIRALASG